MSLHPTSLGYERYINLETFKRDGQGVKTPVWCAAVDGAIGIFTDGTSFKVKRIRREGRCRVAACDVRGKVSGAWHDGTARVVDDDPALEARVYAALLEKYGWQMAIGNFTSRLFGRIGRRKILMVELKL